jgi:hypothetical protein
MARELGIDHRIIKRIINQSMPAHAGHDTGGRVPQIGRCALLSSELMVAGLGGAAGPGIAMTKDRQRKARARSHAASTGLYTAALRVLDAQQILDPHGDRPALPIPPAWARGATLARAVTADGNLPWNTGRRAPRALRACRLRRQHATGRAPPAGRPGPQPPHRRDSPADRRGYAAMCRNAAQGRASRRVVMPARLPGLVQAP